MKSKNYNEFIEKFQPKLTTDDCLTPPLVYEAIKNWVCKEYQISEVNIIRPFWPGANYKTIKYSPTDVVIDNPPFSILAQICNWYLERNIKFFLFAPSLTLFSSKKNFMKINHIITNEDIIYENGAKVKTSFVTNLGYNEIVAQTAPSLGMLIKEAAKKTQENKVRKLPKYEYPDHVITAAMLQKYCNYGIDFKIKQNECKVITQLDAQKSYKKTIYGAGLILSNTAAQRKKAAEKAVAEKTAPIVWKLSNREKEIILSLE